MEQQLQLIDALAELSERITPQEGASQLVQELINKTHELMEMMHQAHPDESGMLLSALDDEQPVLQAIVRLVRSYHAQIKAIQQDLPELLGDLAHEEIATVSERLQHILEMTDKAANRTMDLAEAGLQAVGDRRGHMAEALALVTQLQQAPANSAELCQQLHEKLMAMQHEDEALEANFTDILVAQDYQDLTGQIIQRVVKLIGEIDQSLIELIQRYGRRKPEPAPAENELVLRGPLHDKSEEKKNQSDVDDLLNQLGF
jgi:chemotaxis protein CheZ